MRVSGIARLRGIAALEPLKGEGRFMRFPNHGEARGEQFHSIRFPRALLASTNPKSLKVQKMGQFRICAAWDSFLNPETATPSEQPTLSEYSRLGFPRWLENWDGDFAVSIYEEASNTLFLARDRIGIRPVYYVVNRQWIAFSSQPLALTVLPGVGCEPHPVYLGLYAGCHYRTFDNDPHASPYLHVRQLPAGHWLRWCGGTLEIQRYWSLADMRILQDSEEVLAKKYREKLFQAVQSRLQTAKRPGFLLSGGMDSSSVLSAAVRISGHKHRAYSSTYEDKSFDESKEIRTLLSSKVSHWSNVRVGEENIFEIIRQMVKIHEEPVATATWLSHYEVCRQASADGRGSLFTGLGGDELNAGEYEHFIFFFADLHQSGNRKRLDKEILAWQRHHNHPLYCKNREVAMHLIKSRTHSAIPGSVRPDQRLYLQYRSCLNPETFDLALFYPVLDRIFSDSLRNRCYQDIFRETAPCCLRAQDRNGWAYGLPHHNPFYDPALVELMFQVPGKMKIRNGVTKYLLRKAMKGILPESTRNRIKKTGWNAPAHKWFCGKNGDFLKDIIRSGPVETLKLYRKSEVDKIIDEHHEIVTKKYKKENHMMFLWQIANLGTWLHALKTER